MLAATDLELEFSRKGFGGDNSLRNLDLRKISLEKWKEAARPGGHHSRGVVRVGSTRKQVIRCVEREEALGMFGCDEDARRVVDADHLIQRRMHHQHRTSERGDGLLNVENLNRL